MHDLTTGSIPRHILRLALPMCAGMILQTSYYLIDLWFVGRLGDAAVAGVSAAGNVQMVIMALTQVLGVGTMSLIAHAVGRKDQQDANVVFNQSALWSLACGAFVLVVGYALSPVYLGAVSADAATQAAGVAYLRWYLPGLGLQFMLVSTGAALRGTGIVRPAMMVQMVTVVLNMVLAPVLIAGWGTGRPMGVAGAGLASTIAIVVAIILMLGYFVRMEHYVRFDRALFTVRWDVLMRMLRIGVPSGAEFALMFLMGATIYFVIRDFGAAAQAGYGIGVRVMQAVFLPAMAVAFSAAPLAGQNMGAGQMARVRDTFHWTAIIGSVLMAILTLLCQWNPGLLVQGFSKEPEVIAVAAEYLRVISLNFVANGLLFTCSGMFQALGNTIPAMVSSAMRLVIFALPALWMARRPGFALHDVWVLGVVTMTVQAALTGWLLVQELRRRGAYAPLAAASVSSVS
jgi:putative MATE family efflux protein